MKWCPDKTGRFRQRPYYLDDDLEQICEDAITSFLQKQHGTITYPISTSDLTILLEQHVDDLDNGCDLDEGVDGFTDFFPNKRPKVQIARRLQEAYLENRLRTTLTHEYGHVRLHGFLFQLDDDLRHLFEGKPEQVRSRCRRETIETRAPAADWMEWQAGFACGALLMPKTALTKVVTAFRNQHQLLSDIAISADAGRALITTVTQAFQVSREAATVRLKERHLIVEQARPSLFP